VQAAINTAAAGQTIRICAGTYNENLIIDQSLTLIGAGEGTGPGNTILKGSGTDTAVRNVGGNTAGLQRLRITGGSDLDAGGVLNYGTLTLTHCTVTGNMGSGGGGIRNSGIIATLTLTGCTITENQGDHGGGIHNSGTAHLIDSEVTGNNAAFGGGIRNWLGTLTLDAASRVTGNTASSSAAGGIYNDGGTVTLSSAANVAGNTPDNCDGPTPVPLCVD
jgi:hypothetical protein